MNDLQQKLSFPFKTDFCSLGFHSCHMHATCMVRNDIVTCTCNKNYYGDGKSCVDPCKQLKCPAHSYCFRGLNGQAKCICDSGYTYEEGDCESVQGKRKDYTLLQLCLCRPMHAMGAHRSVKHEIKACRQN